MEFAKSGNVIETHEHKERFQRVVSFSSDRARINISPNQWQFLPRIRQGTVHAPYGGGVRCNRELWAAA